VALSPGMTPICSWPEVEHPAMAPLVWILHLYTPCAYAVQPAA
jgi:hypothetical protein